MANTYTQLYIHFVFAVKNRDSIINRNWRDELYKYISGIIKNLNHKLFCINGMPDHIHFLVSINPNQSISDLMREIKCNSSKWINEKRLAAGKFEWQEGYAAFSYGKSQLNDVIAYINNQEEHHKNKTFREEYLAFLEKYEVKYDERYLLKEIE